MTRLHLTRCVAAFLLLYGVTGHAEENPDAVVARLAKVSTYAFGGVGFAGIISKGEIDFKLILSQPAPVALTAFEKVFADGNPEAKAYALAGMKKLNPARFKELVAIAEASTEKVTVMRGCILSREPLQMIARQIDSAGSRF